MLYSVTCYFDTGLEENNCLESLNQLETLGFRSVTYPDVFLLQDNYRSSVKIACTYSQIVGADYCVISDVGYWITGIAMVNENMCELSLKIDYFTTVGLKSIEIIGGWCTRKCVTSDKLFDNTIAEPFTPQEPLTLDLGAVLKPSTSADSDYKVLVSTVDLENIDFIADSYKDEANDMIVTVPKIPVAGEPTTFAIKGIADYQLPCASCYNYDQVAQEVQTVRSLGVESAIVDSYTIPARYVAVGSATTKRHARIEGVNESIDSKLKVSYATVKNKKALSGQFMKYVLLSLITGEQQEFSVEDIVSPSNSVSWNIFADPLPDGCPRVRPTYYHNTENTAFFGVVNGGQWQKNPLVFRQPSGSLIAETQYNRQMADITRNSVTSMLNNAIGIATNPISWVFPEKAIAKGAFSSAVDLINTEFEMQKQTLNFQTQQNIVAPDIQYNVVHSLQNYYGNYFYELRYRLSDADLSRFDDFLSAFGYAVSERLSISAFRGRTNHNFVKADNVQVKTPRGRIYNQGIESLIQAGIRVWHTAPNQSRLYNNPIA